MSLRMHICPLIVAAVFTSCSPVKSESSNENALNEYGIVHDQAVNWDDCLSQKEERYLVFFHADSCGHCQIIMEDVIAFAQSGITKTYFLDVGKQKDKIRTCYLEDLTIGAESVDELAILGTPTIIEVEDGMTIANVPGKESCLTFLNEQRMTYKK